MRRVKGMDVKKERWHLTFIFQLIFIYYVATGSEECIAFLT